VTTAAVSASEFLNEVLSSSAIYRAAAVSHDTWYKSKQLNLLNLSHPFLGAGPAGKKTPRPDSQPTRVRDFRPQALTELLAREGKLYVDITDGSREVFHPLFVEFDKLPTETQAAMTIPMLALCKALGDFILPHDATLLDLETVLVKTIHGQTPANVAFIKKLTNACLSTGWLMSGEANAHPSFLLCSSLNSLDNKLEPPTSLEAAQMLLNMVREEIAKG
jgi:hypothetical protein